MIEVEVRLERALYLALVYIEGEEYVLERGVLGFHEGVDEVLGADIGIAELAGEGIGAPEGVFER
jgi:hypothetical protein